MKVHIQILQYDSHLLNFPIYISTVNIIPRQLDDSMSSCMHKPKHPFLPFDCTHTHTPTHTCHTQYSSQGQTVCSACPLGQSCSTPDGSPESCKLGEFSNGTHCQLCQRGFYCPDPSLDPVICPDGLFQDNVGATSCKVCPAGHSCLDPAISPVSCEAGMFSLARYSNCLVCEPT